MKTLQTPVKWKLGFEGTKHTFTGYKSKTVTDTVNDFARWYYKNHTGYKHFGHALEQYLKRVAVLPNEFKTLRHNVIERIKMFWWSENPTLEYFQLTESVVNYARSSHEDDVCFFLHQCAGSPVKNDTPLTTPTTNDNIGFV